MTPAQFIAKWRAVELTERSAAQQHFLDLCDLVGHPKPAQADPTGDWFTFERGAAMHGGGDGWADVWKKGFFAIEYKGKHKDLVKAYDQLLRYRADLENPPLLVVCDLDRILVHTNFTATAHQLYEIPLADLASPRHLEILRFLFHDPEQLRPVVTSPVITRDAATKIGNLAEALRARGHDPALVAPFLDRLIFCLFVEDIHLLPVRTGSHPASPILKQLLSNFRAEPAVFAQQLRQLFAAMAGGGYFGTDKILHFNGDLFRDSTVLELTPAELTELHAAAELDWAKVEPSIFGTLFERGLDPAKRAQLGAHYTSREDIDTLVEPVLMAPLRRRWQTLCDRVETSLAELPASPPPTASATTKSAHTRALKSARQAAALAVHGFLRTLRATTVLDPACGSGNFLYVALRKLKDLERDVIEYCLYHDIPSDSLPLVGPHQVYGIELNPYAYHLAQLVVWIGHLQWTHAYGYGIAEPVLQPLARNFQNKDAILDLTDPEHPKEPEWPKVDVIVGNPPFLGNKRMKSELGDAYCSSLWSLYGDRLAATSDLCCYWFEKARAQLEAGSCRRAGLLATTGIKQVGSRHVLERIADTGKIFFVISDRDWTLDGASVRISMVGFTSADSAEPVTLDGCSTERVNSNLTGGQDATLARPIAANARLCFMGTTKVGAFDLPASEAANMLANPNPHSRPNSDVLRPFCNGSDLVREPSDRWIVDFGVGSTQAECALYEMPFGYVVETVKPTRERNARQSRAANWWRLGETLPAFRDAVKPLHRYLATARVAKHRVFVWLGTEVLPDSKVIAIALDSDLAFGLLQSRFHEVWTNATCALHGGERRTYLPTDCFETFPFPWPPGQEPLDDPRVQAIADAARQLDQLRSAWLNPSVWTQQVIFEFPGSTTGPWARYLHDQDSRGIGTVRYPRRVPRDAACAALLKARTLTNLYNHPPTWLDLAHRRLDEAVAAAYNLSPDLPADALLAELLARNQSLAESPAPPSPSSS